MATKSKRRAAGGSVERNVWGATNTLGAIRVPRKSVPRRIPAPFHDFSVKTAIPFYLWPNARSVGTKSDTERQFSMRLTPAFGRPLAHTADNGGDPMLCTLFAVREDRPCGSKAMLHFFVVVRAQPRSLVAILRPNKSTTYRHSKSIGQNVRKMCNASQHGGRLLLLFIGS